MPVAQAVCEICLVTWQPKTHEQAIRNRTCSRSCANELISLVRRGELPAAKHHRNTTVECAVDGCNNFTLAKGLCKKHYSAAARSSDREHHNELARVSQRKHRKIRSEKQRAKRNENVEKFRSIGRASYHKDPRKGMWRAARWRARRACLPFDISIDDIQIPDTCPALGIPIVLNSPRADGSPSLDRTVPELGYVRGNVRVISWRANALKNNATASELRMLAQYVETELQKSNNADDVCLGIVDVVYCPE